MKTIHKYRVPIPAGHPLTIEMRQDAEVLHVDTQHCYGDVVWLWALVDTDKPLLKYRFELYGTGHEVPMDVEHESGVAAMNYKRLRHVGSFIIDDGHFVGHLFQVMNGFGGPELE